MTSRDRVILALNHRVPDRIPIDLGSTKVTGISIFSYNALKQRLGIRTGPSRISDVYQMLAWPDKEILDRFHVDCLFVPKLSYRFNMQFSEWKIHQLMNGDWVYMPKAFNPSSNANGDWILIDSNGATARLPNDGYYFDYLENTISNAKIDIDKLRFDEWTDEDYRFCSDICKRLYEDSDKALVGDFDVNLSRPGSYENWFLLLASDPSYMKEYYDKRTEYILKLLRGYKQAVGEMISVIDFGQDFGTQMGELIHPNMFKELFAPFWKRIFSWIHDNSSWKVFFHSCGSIYRLIPSFIECGIDILNPVQCSATNMNPRSLKQEFGDKMVFWGGGVDTQDILPFGKVKDVREQVKERISIFGKDGGFIFNPVHNIQFDVPPDNIIACFDAAYELGKYD